MMTGEVATAPGQRLERNGRASRLTAYLGDLLGGTVRVLSLEQIEGGFSRYMYRAVVDTAEGCRTFALRAEAPAGVLETDLEREYKIVRALSETRFRVPPVLGFESSGAVLGRRFMTTGWLAGSALNPWRANNRQASDQLEQLCRSWLADVAWLHSMDPAVLTSAGVDKGVDAASYVTAQVAYWVARIRRCEHHPGLLVERACRWLEEEIPSGGDTAIVHGDLRIGNMLVEGTDVTAFLDWEMAGVGDWRADIGYALMPYHAGKLLAPVPPSSNGLVHPRVFLDLYRELTGRHLSDAEVVYFVVLGCVKMISILCTGIDAFMSRRSSDPRLAWLNVAIPGLVQDALDLIDEGLSW